MKREARLTLTTLQSKNSSEDRGSSQPISAQLEGFVWAVRNKLIPENAPPLEKMNRTTEYRAEHVVSGPKTFERIDTETTDLAAQVTIIPMPQGLHLTHFEPNKGLTSISFVYFTPAEFSYRYWDETEQPPKHPPHLRVHFDYIRYATNNDGKTEEVERGGFWYDPSQEEQHENHSTDADEPSSQERILDEMQRIWSVIGKE